MNKKVIIIISIISIILIGGIVGCVCYTNSPDYVINKYIKAYNKGDYDTMESMEYNYEDYEIKRYNNGDGYYISEIKKIDSGDNQDFIDSLTVQLYERGEVKIDNSKITYITFYEISGEDFYALPYTAVGKVGNKNMIVYSPFYYVK